MSPQAETHPACVDRCAPDSAVLRNCVTHDVYEALKFDDHIAILAEGRLARYARPLKSLTSPADEYVRAFLGDGAASCRLGLLRLADVDGSPTEPLAAAAGQVGSAARVYEAPDRILTTGADRVVIGAGDDRPERTFTLRELLLAGGQAEEWW